MLLLAKFNLLYFVMWQKLVETFFLAFNKSELNFFCKTRNLLFENPRSTTVFHVTETKQKWESVGLLFSV